MNLSALTALSPLDGRYATKVAALRPLLSDFVLSMPRGATVVYPKDAAQIVAMATIGLADGLGLPVSTTHVLSSGVAGTMAAHNSGLQMRTLRSIAMAWVFTLPAAMLLGAGFFFLFTVWL